LVSLNVYLQVTLDRLHAKLNADMLLDFAIHRRQNETRSRKNTRVQIMCVQSVVSRGRLMQ
jgi:hypothetical protein